MPSKLRWQPKRRQVLDPMVRRFGAEVLVRSERDLREAAGLIRAGKAVTARVIESFRVTSPVTLPIHVDEGGLSLPSFRVVSDYGAEIVVDIGVDNLFIVTGAAWSDPPGLPMVSYCFDGLFVRGEGTPTTHDDQPTCASFLNYTGYGDLLATARTKIIVKDCTVFADEFVFLEATYSTLKLLNNDAFCDLSAATNMLHVGGNALRVIGNLFQDNGAGGYATLNLGKTAYNQGVFDANVLVNIDDVRFDGTTVDSVAIVGNSFGKGRPTANKADYGLSDGYYTTFVGNASAGTNTSSGVGDVIASNS